MNLGNRLIQKDSLSIVLRDNREHDHFILDEYNTLKWLGINANLMNGFISLRQKPNLTRQRKMRGRKSQNSSRTRTKINSMFKEALMKT